MSPSARHSLIRPAALVVLAATLLPLSWAQEGQRASLPAPTSFITVTSRLVVLDIVVTDKSGRPRNDLTQEDFSIFENGQPQRILNFESPSFHLKQAQTPVTSTAGLQALAPDVPATIIVLDEINTRFEDMAYARSTIKKHLNAQAGQLHSPTMLLAASMDKFELLQDYTQDPNTIQASLNHHLSGYPWRLKGGDSVLQQMAISLSVLERIAQASSGHRGRKNVIWIGKGFPGVDLTSPSLDPTATQAISSTLQKAINVLQEARITLYTIDPSLISTSPSMVTDGDTATSLDSVEEITDPFGKGIQFAALAAATGGKTFTARNDLNNEMAEGVSDGENYYTIAYHPTNISDLDKPYRSIKVGIKVPNLVEAYRTGYYAGNSASPTTNNSPGFINASMDAAAESTLVYTGLDVLAEPKPHTPDVYLLGIPQRQLTWSPNGEKQAASLRILAAAVDKNGRVLRRSTFDVVAERANADQDDPTEIARLDIHVPWIAGTTRLRFVIREIAGGKIGTADLIVSATKRAP